MQWLVISQLSSHSRFLDNFWLFQSALPFFFFLLLFFLKPSRSRTGPPTYGAHLCCRNLVANFWWAVSDFLLILCSVFVPGGRWGLALAYEQVWEMKKQRHLHFWLCFMWTITSDRAAGSQFTGVFSSSASERTLLLMKGENMLFAPCHFFPQLTPAVGLLECLQEPLQFIETGGMNLVLAGEVSWSGWCRVEGSRDTLRWRRGHNRGVKSFLTAAWELNLRNFLPSCAFKR